MNKNLKAFKYDSLKEEGFRLMMLLFAMIFIVIMALIISGGK